MNKWLPIETAPKDGTSFLVWPRDDEHPTAHWMDDAFRVNCCGQVITEATHWMPLPNPPIEPTPEEFGCDC